MKPEFAERKCITCRHMQEVAGGPDHGDIRCTERESPLYDIRILERTGELAGQISDCPKRESDGRRTAVITGATIDVNGGYLMG